MYQFLLWPNCSEAFRSTLKLSRSRFTSNQKSLPWLRGLLHRILKPIPISALVFSPWTTLDVDGSATWGIEDYTFLHAGEAMAYIVFNPASTTPSLSGDPYIQPHGGSRYAACFASMTPPNNDWIMSPQIELGSNGHLKFWVKSYTDHLWAGEI